MRSVNYREEFGTSEELTSFIEFIKQHEGSAVYKISTEYMGKQTHSGVAIPLKQFGIVVQKRLIKSVIYSMNKT